MKGSGRNEWWWHYYIAVATAFARQLRRKEREQVSRDRWLENRRHILPPAGSRISLPLRICNMRIREDTIVHIRVLNFLLFLLLLFLLLLLLG